MGKKAVNEPGASSSDPLVGMFFLSEGRKGGLQGRVIGKAGSLYVVQLYSWMDDGEPSERQLKSAADMKTWTFYTTHEEWRRVGGQVAEDDWRESQQDAT